MKNVSAELKVGIFAITVIIILSYMTFKVGRMPFMWEKGYKLYAEFDDASGLDERSRVKLAGVDVGIIEKIDLADGKARLTLIINPDVKLYKNTRASLKMSGLLGDKYLALSRGTPDQPLLRSGDTITDVTRAADIEELAKKMTSAASDISALATSLKDVFGEKEKQTFTETLNNLRDITRDVKQITKENKDSLRKIIAQLEVFTKALSEKGPGFVDDMSRVGKNLGDKGPKLLDDMSKLVNDLKEVVEENRYAFKESMENLRTGSKSVTEIARKIESGEGTLGKLVKDEKLYNSLSKVSDEVGKSLDVASGMRTFLDFHTEYNTGEAEWKGYFDLTLQPKKDKYYILGVVADPKGSVETTDKIINGVETTEEETKSKIEFSAQYAQRFEDLALRIGMTENTFGFGADYFFNKDLGRAKFDIWDLSAKEADAKRAHARVGIDYRMFKYIFISTGIDNLLNSSRRGIYVGGGLKFEDEDFKYLLGRMPALR
ncbi:MAG: MCE family protein [Nitrospirae bacterium]|nr:MCE family protein [Nitrospirota bacterium]